MGVGSGPGAATGGFSPGTVESLLADESLVAVGPPDVSETTGGAGVGPGTGVGVGSVLASEGGSGSDTTSR